MTRPADRDRPDAAAPGPQSSPGGHLPRKRLAVYGRPPLGDEAELERWTEEFLALIRAEAQGPDATAGGTPTDAPD